MVSVVAPTRDQSEIIRSYTKAALQSDLLAGEVVDDLKQSLTLSNGVRVRSLTGNFTSVRGYTQLAVVVDELCFFNIGGDENRVRSDTELIRAIRPALLTTGGLMICVSTKYSPKGWAYRTWKSSYGNDTSRSLVWDAASRVMNPTLSQADIEDAIADDPCAARAEYQNMWREDVCTFIERSLVESVVIQGRKELLPRTGIVYHAFCDMSGGRQDSASLCIGHMANGKVVIDKLLEYKPPFSPQTVVGLMADELRRYKCRYVTGDRYSAEFVVQAFKNHYVTYRASEQNKNELYLELLPRICSREIELLDNERLTTQLSGLERRTRSGGRDIVDHPPNGHDDLANAVAGLVAICGTRQLRAGGWSTVP
jgi:hypothetical protein